MADFPVGSDVPVDSLDTQVLSTASTIGLSPLLNKILAFMRAAIAKIGTGASTPTANSVLVGNGTGTSTWITGLTAAYLADAGLGPGVSMVNGTLVASVASSALTITIKTKAGADPSSTDPVLLIFRNATAATGDYTVIRVTTAFQSLVISSGSTLGTANSTAFRLWVVAFNDAGAIRLGVVNTLAGTAPSLSIMPLSGWGIADSTAEGGAGAADSAQVFYTGTAVSAKTYAVLGYLSYESGLATAGTWSGTPTRTQILARDTPLPGAIIQRQRSQTGAVATGTTVMPVDDTIPQNTEGDQYMSQAITPTSAANLLVIDAQLNLSSSAVLNFAIALFQDATAGALAAIGSTSAVAFFVLPYRLYHAMLAATTSSTTFKVRAGPASAATMTFNGQAGARLFGGVYGSVLEIQEVMR